MQALTKTKYTLGLLLFALVLSSCVPALGPIVQAPTFSIRGEIEMISYELPLPLISAGQVTFRVPMDITNPNDFEVFLNRVDFDFNVNNRLAVTGAFTDGVTLVARGSSAVSLDIIIPLESGIALIEDIVAMVAGQATNVSLDGKVTIDVFGAAEIYAKTRLLSGQIN